MMKAAPLILCLGTVLAMACASGTNKSATPATIATAPPAQSAVISTTPARTLQTPGALARPPVPLTAVTEITNQVRLQASDLPSGYSLGQLQAFQSNETAVTGYDDPKAVLDLFTSTGRQGGVVQQVTTPENSGSGASVTVDVWRDAAGAKTYFDQFPRPPKDLDFKPITLPQPLGDQSFAFQYNVNGATGYSISWRRGRIVLGAGESFPSGSESLNKLMTLVSLLDKKAQAAKQ